MNSQDKYFYYCPICKADEHFEVLKSEYIKSNYKRKVIEIPIVETNQGEEQEYKNDEGISKKYSLPESVFRTESKEIVYEVKSIGYMLLCANCHKEIKLLKLTYEDDEETNQTLIPEHFFWQRESVYGNEDNLPKLIFTVYLELLNSFNQKLFISAGITIRLLIEMICQNQKISGRNLKQKIDNLPIKEYQKEVLHEIRDIGNSTAHKAFQPTIDELNSVIDVVEVLLGETFVNPEKLKKSLNTLEKSRNRR